MALIDTPSIVKLTPEQEDQLAQYLKDWQSISNKQPADRQAVNTALQTIYGAQRIESTPIIYCQSPWQFVVVRALLRLFATSQGPALRHTVRDALKDPVWSKASQCIEEHWADLDDLLSNRRKEGFENSTFLSDDFFNDLRSPIQSVLLEKLSQAAKTLESQIGIKAKLQLRSITQNPSQQNGRSMLIGGGLFGGRFGDRLALPPRLEQLIAGDIPKEMLAQCSAELRKQIEVAAIEFTKGMDFHPRRREPDSERINPSIDWLFNVSLEYMAMLGDLHDLATYGYVVEYLAPKLDPALEQYINNWSTLKRNLFHICCFDKLCLACEYPAVVKFNNQGRLHCETGAALEFRDGYKFHAINGVSVPADIIENRSSITVERIDAETNVEIRRTMVNLYGLQKYLEDSRAIPIDRNESGVLYRKDVRDDEPIVVVKVKNSTADPDGTFNEYFLRVPPYIKTVGAAIAWTFNMESEEYRPTAES